MKIRANSESGYPVTFTLTPHPMVPGRYFLFLDGMTLTANCESVYDAKDRIKYEYGCTLESEKGN